MRIAICGGTFDPFHRGHLEPIVAVREEMNWDRVLYIPAYRQPFKQERVTVSGFHRFAMAALATQDVPFARLSAMELERGEISWSVDTLEELRRRFPDASLEWVIGDDNLPTLGEWKAIERIFELANFIVLTRDGGARVVDDAASRPAHGCTIFAPNETVPVSSTEIRKRIAAGEEIDSLVDPRVARYIRQHGLYREDQRERFD